MLDPIFPPSRPDLSRIMPQHGMDRPRADQMRYEPAMKTGGGGGGSAYSPPPGRLPPSEAGRRSRLDDAQCRIVAQQRHQPAAVPESVPPGSTSTIIGGIRPYWSGSSRLAKGLRTGRSR